MRIISGKLYLEFGEMVECGVSENYLWKAKSTGTNCWNFIKDPKDARRVLIGWDELRDQYKRMVEVRYGNPWDYVAKEPILERVVMDWKAEEYYRGYTYQIDGARPGEVLVKHLPDEAVVKYTRGAAWLAFVNGIMANKDKAKKDYGLAVLEIMGHVASLIALEKERGKAEGSADVCMVAADFPSSYQRLMVKAREYAAQGYDVLISKMYGNKCSAKIGKVVATAPLLTETTGENALLMVPNSPNKGGAFDPNIYKAQMAVIRAVCEKHQNFDAAQVVGFVNPLFKANGWETLSVSTIRRIIKQNEDILTAARRGSRTHRSNIDRQVKRVVTELPLAYWTMDGWNAELMYQTRTAKGIQYNGLVIVVVLDAWSKYPIGYAIGERETPELIRLALKNALLHVRELFGATYRPVQLQSDRYQLKNLTPFYTAMAHLFTPASVGNAKSKVVEPYFNYLNRNYCQKQYNWSGFGVTSRKEKQVNGEYVDKIKGSFPDKAGVEKQLHAIMARERQQKRDVYVSKWPDMPEERKYVMSEEQWITAIGRPLGKTNRITGEGLVKTLDGVKYVYDSFDPEFRRLRHIDWQIIADLDNMDKVLAVTPEGKGFLLEQTRAIPMDIMSATDEDHEYRARIMSFNKENKQKITDIYEHDADVAREVVNNTPLDLRNEDELALKLMLTHNGQQKEGLQDAKGLPQPKKKALPMMSDDAYMAEWQRKQVERMNSITDFSKY